MSIAILMNPKSGGGSKHGGRLEHAASKFPNLLYEQLDDINALPALMKQFAKEKVELLIISGGDGTVQAAITALIATKAFKALPKLLLLPHGTTNMTAADIGFWPNQPEALLQAVSRRNFISRTTNIKRRAPIRIDGLEASKTQYGFFFGCGVITRSVLKCQSDIHGAGLKGAWATSATLGSVLLKSIISRKIQDPDRFNQPTPMSVAIDGELLDQDQNLLLIASSLKKLILKSQPFWNQTGKQVQMTLVGYPVKSLLRNCLRMMYGGLDRKLDPDLFISRDADKIELKIETPIVLDGEILDPGPNGIKITAGPEFDFICGG